MKKSIAIIGKNIFPNQGPRSQRTTNLAIELAARGYEVTVFAILGEYDYSDFEAQNKIKIRNLGKSFLGNSNSDGKTKSTKLIFRILRRLFGNALLFPDIELVYFIYKNRKAILSHDCIISIAVPYTTHFGVNLLNRKKKVWISDCGDPFTGNPHKSFPFYFKYVESNWAKHTDYITIPTERAIQAYPVKYKDKIRIIPQGFPITSGLSGYYKGNEIPTFCFSGNVYENHRDPSEFLNFLSLYKMDFKFIVYTKSVEFFRKYQDKLREKLIINDYIPRDELLVKLAKMDFLINFKNNSDVQIPSKLIDYYMTGRPVLEISSQFSSSEKEEFKRFLKADYPTQINNLKDYDIKNVANKFIDLINSKN